MKSGFLLSNNPRVSFLTNIDRNGTNQTHRKYTLDDLSLERNIGNGNFSEVWHVTLKSNPLQSYALKIYNKKRLFATNQTISVVQERNSLLKLNNPGNDHVIKLIDTFKDETNVYLLYEFIDGCELWDEIKFSGILRDALARCYILQILDGLKYIHGCDIVHRDLKCENIVIDRHNNLKIIDFGSSLSLDDEPLDERVVPAKPNNLPDTVAQSDSPSYRRTKRYYKHYVGTPNFMPPESLSNKDSGKLRDLWSLGCLIYQLLCGRPCFYASTEYFIYKKVKACQLEFPPHINPHAKDLIIKLVDPIPEKRLGANDFSAITRHKYFEHAQFHTLTTELSTKESYIISSDVIKHDATLDKDFVKTIKSKCVRIGKLVTEMESNRNLKEGKDFEEKFEKLINDLQIISTSDDIERNVLNNSIKLMHWVYEQTKQQIIVETNEANLWLDPN